MGEDMKSRIQIGEFVRLTGITVKTVLHYHKIGLLAEPMRSPGGYRLYGPAELNRMQAIVMHCQSYSPDRWFVWKVLHFILGIWAVVWLWADVQAMRLYPHQITSKGVKFSLGLRCCQEVPWEYMHSVKRIQKSAPGFGPGLDKKTSGSLFLSLGEKCNVEIEFNPPQSFQGMISNMPDIQMLYLSLENPDEFIATIPLSAF